ncbi:MAG: type II secretion system minor pseudopilin GspJ [Granulosicoccaceae bacterium]
MNRSSMYLPAGLKSRGGFTLIELLVAMFLLSIMGAAGFKMLSQINSARGIIEEQSDRIHSLQRTFYWMAEDVTQVIDRPVRSALDSNLPGIQFSLEGGALMEFTRSGWANPADDVSPTRSSLQRIRYSLEGDGFYRSYWYHLDPLEEEPTKRRRLLDGVENLTLRFVDKQGEWKTNWPPLDVEDPGMPRAIEFTFELDDFGTVSRLFALPG